jgi:hypothetical protein
MAIILRAKKIAMEHPKRPRQNAAAMQEMVAEWARSNVSQKQFCLVRDIPLPVFSYWRKKFVEQSAQGHRQPGFKAIALESRGCSFEITYPNGVRLNTGTCIDHALLHKLINLW